jgi:hypothetical protein
MQDNGLFKHDQNIVEKCQNEWPDLSVVSRVLRFTFGIFNFLNALNKLSS